MFDVTFFTYLGAGVFMIAFSYLFRWLEKRRGDEKFGQAYSGMWLFGALLIMLAAFYGVFAQACSRQEEKKTPTVKHARVPYVLESLDDSNKVYRVDTLYINLEFIDGVGDDVIIRERAEK